MPPVAGICNPQLDMDIPHSSIITSKLTKKLAVQDKETADVLSDPEGCLTRDIVGFANAYGLGLNVQVNVDIRRAQYFCEYLNHLINSTGNAVLLAMQTSFPYLEVDGVYKFVVARQRGRDGKIHCYTMNIKTDGSLQYLVDRQLELSTDDKLNTLCETFQNGTSN